MGSAVFSACWSKRGEVGQRWTAHAFRGEWHSRTVAATNCCPHAPHCGFEYTRHTTFGSHGVWLSEM